MLLYLVKLVLLLMNRRETLAKLTKAFRIPEMIISTLFLVTGVILLVQLPAERVDMMMIIKIVMVLAAIPLAVVGFRKSNKLLALLSVVLIILTYGVAEMHSAGVGAKAVEVPAELVSNPVEQGKHLYYNATPAACVVCHGENGKGGIAGAKDMTISKLSDAEMAAMIKNGKNAMPKYKNLTDDQVNSLVAYIRTLK
jgi:mono/diheme cytochrome c family protein